MWKIFYYLKVKIFYLKEEEEEEEEEERLRLV